MAGYTTTSKGTRKIFFVKLEAKKKGPFHNNGEMKLLFCLEKDYRFTRKSWLGYIGRLIIFCQYSQIMYFRFVDF